MQALPAPSTSHCIAGDAGSRAARQAGRQALARHISTAPAGTLHSIAPGDCRTADTAAPAAPAEQVGGAVCGLRHPLVPRELPAATDGSAQLWAAAGGAGGLRCVGRQAGG